MSAVPANRKRVSEGNPAFNMMGLPKIHTWRLPSRNWCIFWSILGSFGGAIAYDRYEKKQIIARYRARVSHLAEEPLQPLQMPRRINIYMGAPPGDTIHIAREHFNEYIKPVLNSAGVDFDLIEGRMQGDVRHRVAQSIRDRKVGQDNLSDLQRNTRDKLQYDSLAGDIILGRHSYKEYIRGCHEGYLGPCQEPESITRIMHPPLPGDPITEASDAVPTNGDAAAAAVGQEKTEESIKAEVDAIKANIPSSPPSYITPTEYASAADPTDLKTTDFVYVPMQHLLGFLNTPWRIYRFLNRRKLAEGICSATTAAVLADRIVEFDAARDLDYGKDEEMDWPKKNRQKSEGVWVEDVVVDDRVTAALRVYQYVKPEAKGDLTEQA